MTRPLPWHSCGNRSQPTATVFALFEPVSRALHLPPVAPRVATAGLHKGSIMSCLLWLHAYEPKSVAPGAARAGRITPLQHQPVARALNALLAALVTHQTQRLTVALGPEVHVGDGVDEVQATLRKPLSFRGFRIDLLLRTEGTSTRPVARGQKRTQPKGFRQAVSRFEPNTAHLHSRSEAQARVVPWVRRDADSAEARAVHTAVHNLRSRRSNLCSAH
jgi:hypothetical protein